MNKKSIVRLSDEELDQYGKPLIDRVRTALLICRALLGQGGVFSWSCISSGAAVSSGAGSPAAKACRVPLEVKPVPTICPAPLAGAATAGAAPLLSLSSTEMVSAVPSTATSGRL